MSANRGAKITLYWLDRSRAQRVMWLMEELSLSYDIKTFHRRPNGTAPPELKTIHPLGKSPILSIATPTTPKPMVLAESGAILEYLLDHFGQKSNLVPKRYRDGQDGQIGGETEAWMRYRYFMHYAEGSLMSPIQVQLIMNALKNAPVPFFLKPIVNMITGKVSSEFLAQELETHFKFVDDQLGSAPESGSFLCGSQLTAADIQMIIPVQAALRSANMAQPGRYPGLEAYAKKLEGFDAYKVAVRKVEELEGKPFVPI